MHSILQSTMNFLKEAAAIIQSQFQIFRLRAERIWSERFDGPRPRVIATACWSFPIYSQTFVYQELTELARNGTQLRFLYTKKNDRKGLPEPFSILWNARRKLNLHPITGKRAYERYKMRWPEKVEELIGLICKHAEISREKLFEERHFYQAFAFTQMVEAYRPHYIHSYFFYEGTFFAMVASFLLDIPRGVSCYSDHMLKDYVLKLIPMHLAQCSLVIATSKQIKEELVAISPSANPNRILVKPNAIRADYFPAIDRTEPKSGEPFRIITVSRIEPKKGLVYLVEAVRHLRDRNLNVEAHIIGGVDNNVVCREYAYQLEKKIQDLGLSEIVHLEGTRTQKEVQQFLARGHLFVAPFIETDSGDKDGIPTSLLEAMASGLPIIATDAGSIQEVLTNELDGRILEQRNPEALAEALKELLLDREKRRAFGAQAAETIRTQFDVRVSEQIFHDRVRRLLNRTNKQKDFTQDGSQLISVITIFFNAEKYMAEAVESVLAQTYRNWELLLVDDGSTDGSTEIAMEYVKQFPDKIRYVQHENHQNRGMSATRNLGVSNAKGKYIAFLDSDDVWLPHKLEQQLKILQTHPEAVMVYGAPKYWKSWTGDPKDADRDSIPSLDLETERIYDPPALLSALYPLGKASAPCPSDLMLTRRCIESVGGFEEHFLGIYQLYEDQAFLCKTYLHHPVFVSSECWLKYRIHPESCQSLVTASGQYQSVRSYFLDWFASYLKRRSLDAGPIWDRVQSARVQSKTADGELLV
jgi:glycosyltransferase involved in cell wall biosynthesis